MPGILDTQTWTRTITRTYIDFKTLSLVGINGGGYNGGSPATSLKCFGKPDYQEGGDCGHLCYFDLGLEFMLNSINEQIAYIYIHARSHDSSYSNSLSSQFQAFIGNFLYDRVIIELSRLQNCDALIKSFNDSRFKLYDRSYNELGNGSTAYIQEVNGNRERTVVFIYKNNILDMINLY